jgi:hypothetical protein
LDAAIRLHYVGGGKSNGWASPQTAWISAFDAGRPRARADPAWEAGQTG